MKRILNIIGRESGKTSTAILRFLEDEDSVLMVSNENAKYDIVKRISKEVGPFNEFDYEKIYSRIIDYSYLRGSRYSKIIIDELFNFNEKIAAEIISYIQMNIAEEVIIYSSLNIDYIDEQLETIKFLNKKNNFKIINTNRGRIVKRKDIKPWAL